jgi:hypothetical protein
MIKSISATVIAAAAMLVAGAASADISPNGVYSLGSPSNLQVAQSVTLPNCTVTWSNVLTVSGFVASPPPSSNGTGVVAANGKSLGGPGLCSGVSLLNNWTVTADPVAGSDPNLKPIIISGFWAKTLNGECGSSTQTIKANYNVSLQRIEIDASVAGWYYVIPPIPPKVTKACTIKGYVNVSSPLTITNP